MERLIARATSLRNDAARYLLAFVALQLLDLSLTLLCLALGMSEANPLVRSMMASSGNPLLGLLYAKTIALVFGTAFCMAGCTSLLRRLNTAYFAVVLWNLTALVGAVIINH